MAFGIKKREEIIDAITGLNPFTIGSMSGQWWPYGDTVPVGKLAGSWMRELDRVPGPVYVVFSYETPVGWHRASGVNQWTVPDTRYSVTTNHHQSLLKQAIKLRGERIDQAVTSLINRT